MHHLPSVNGSGGHCTTVLGTLVTTTDTNKSCLGDVPLSPRGTASEQIKKLADWGRWEPTAGRSLKKCSRATMQCKACVTVSQQRLE